MLRLEPSLDQRKIAGAVKAREMAAMDDARMHGMEPPHARDIGLKVRMIAVLDQRPVIENIAREQDAGCRFPKRNSAGEWPGV